MVLIYYNLEKKYYIFMLNDKGNNIRCIAMKSENGMMYHKTYNERDLVHFEIAKDHNFNEELLYIIEAKLTNLQSLQDNMIKVINGMYDNNLITILWFMIATLYITIRSYFVDRPTKSLYYVYDVVDGEIRNISKYENKNEVNLNIFNYGDYIHVNTYVNDFKNIPVRFNIRFNKSLFGDHVTVTVGICDILVMKKKDNYNCVESVESLIEIFNLCEAMNAEIETMHSVKAKSANKKVQISEHA